VVLPCFIQVVEAEPRPVAALLQFGQRDQLDPFVDTNGSITSTSDVEGAEPASADLEICRIALDWARTALMPEFGGAEDSGQVFGLEVPVAADALLCDRLAAFFGRNPY
jgi:hypothetical protein